MMLMMMMMIIIIIIIIILKALVCMTRSVFNLVKRAISVDFMIKAIHIAV
jgi:hypothetical protein